VTAATADVGNVGLPGRHAVATPTSVEPSGVDRWRDVLTLVKPGITGLIVLVAVGGFFLAAGPTVDWWRLLAVAGLGTLASAGSAMLNHYLDRDVDAGMRRTRTRPLPAERIAPAGFVAVAGIALLSTGVGGAAVLINPLAAVSILLGGLTYVLVYTIWLKRRSAWNIVIGGFAGSAPALAGGAAATGHWSWAVLSLALLVFLWTPPHFWSLALLLRSDFAEAGLPMLPRMDDPAYSARVVVVSTALLLPPTVLLVVVGPITLPVAVALLLLGAVFVGIAAPMWRTPERRVARRGFIFSGFYLLGVLVALIANWGLLAVGFHPLL
jgi:protoheme IX farnesyltransferase